MKSHKALPPPPSSPSLPIGESPKLDLDSILSPLNPFIVHSERKRRNNYNNYYQYENEFFSHLFNVFINNPSSPINLKTASEYYKINYSTLKSKYQLWKEENQEKIGTMDRRGRIKEINSISLTVIKHRQQC